MNRLITLALAFLLFGCASQPSRPLMTPEKSERLTRAVVWITADQLKLRKPESKAKLEESLKSVNELVSDQNWDVQALAVALKSSGASVFASSDGALALTGAIVLADVFGNEADLKSVEYAKAVILGAQAGLKLALE